MIGIFDSGFGGLTVMKDYLINYPDFDYIYLGDQANSPYGSHSKERINSLVEKNIDFLAKKGCKLIIIACNTASADALRFVQQKYNGNPIILGVIIPATEEALRNSKFGNIGVIGTRATIKSEAYIRELNKYSYLYASTDKRANKEVKIFQKACPLLVPLIEEGEIDTPYTNMILKKYLRSLKNSNIDTLILGCTHYPLLINSITRIMGKKCKLISSSKASSNAINSYFEMHPSLKNELSRNGKRIYYTTDSTERFDELGSKFLGEKIKSEKILI